MFSDLSIYLGPTLFSSCLLFILKKETVLSCKVIILLLKPQRPPRAEFRVSLLTSIFGSLSELSSSIITDLKKLLKSEF